MSSLGVLITSILAEIAISDVQAFFTENGGEYEGAKSYKEAAGFVILPAATSSFVNFTLCCCGMHLRIRSKVSILYWNNFWE